MSAATTLRFRSYYTNALDAEGYAYDVWDTGLRCAPDSAILNQYTAGTVIWAAPYWGYITYDGNVRTAVQNYLDDGGKLFITGQDVAYYYSREHLFCGLSTRRLCPGRLWPAHSHRLSGLTFGIAGGDGANNQCHPDEVDPVGPAQAIFTYQAGAGAMLAEPARA